MTLLLNPLLRGISRSLSPKILSNLLPRLLFRSIYGDSSGEFASPTTARTTDLTIPDHEGILRTFGNGEVGIEGGRVVENLAASTDSPSTQNITVVSGSEYQVRIGADSASGATAVCSGAFTGTLTGDGASAQSFDAAKTASTTTLTITITGAVTDLQVENVTGQANQAPSEYVSSTIGKQVYATANGNTVVVASNVVTEATGASLSPAPAVYCEPAHTNLITYSHEFDNAAWTKFQATITANDTTAPDGSLTADKLNDSNLTGSGTVAAWTSATVTSGVDYCFSVFAKADQLDWLFAEVNGYDTLDAAWFDLTNGVVGTTSGSPVDTGIESYGNGWYRCWIVANTTTDLSGTWRTYVAAEDNNVSVDLDGTSSIFVWGAQVTESSAPLSYIPTSGGTATANATEPVVTWPSGLVNDFLIKVKWTPDNVSGTIALIGSYTDASNSLLLSWASNTLTLTKRVSATDYSATVALTPSADTEYALSVRLSSINGVDVWAASTKGTGDSNTTDAVMASNLSIGDDGNSANHGVGTIRDLRIYKVSPTISDAQALSL